jgi:hypothetical protein
VVVAAGALLAALALLGLVLFAARPTEVGPEGEPTGVQVRLGDDEFRAGRADRLAARIAADGRPFLIADASPARERDIYLQHEGDDEEEGWLAFSARAPGQDQRGCSLVWHGTGFADPCTGQPFPPDGEGLTHYATRVEDGIVLVDLREERDGPA